MSRVAFGPLFLDSQPRALLQEAHQPWFTLSYWCIYYLYVISTYTLQFPKPDHQHSWGLKEDLSWFVFLNRYCNDCEDVEIWTSYQESRVHLATSDNLDLVISKQKGKKSFLTSFLGCHHSLKCTAHNWQQLTGLHTIQWRFVQLPPHWAGVAVTRSVLWVPVNYHRAMSKPLKAQDRQRLEKTKYADCQL